MESRTLAVLADAALVAHLGVALFLVGGLTLVWLGGVGGWKWVRGRAFRLVHFWLMAFVAVETLFGLACPLTSLEFALRERAGLIGATPRGLVARTADMLLYHDLPGWVFAAIYLLFFGAIAATWYLVPPNPKKTPQKE